MSITWSPHHMDPKDVRAAIIGSRSWNKPYRLARVLCVYFQQDGTEGLQVGSTSDLVRDAFSRLYGYEAMIFQIPKGNQPAEALAEALRELVQGMGDDCLAIMHYIGDSVQPDSATGNPNQLHIRPSLGDDIDDDNYPSFSSGRTSDADKQDDTWIYVDSGLDQDEDMGTNNGKGKHHIIPEQDSIDFFKLKRDILDVSPANVLVLLDCCYDARGDVCQGGKELIAACNFKQRCGRGESGFSSQLINRLQHAHDRGQILSTPALYNRLVTKHFESRDETPKLATLPVFLQHACPLPALILYPMSPDTNRYWAAAPTSGTMFQPANVVLSIRVQEPGPGEMNAVAQMTSSISSQHMQIDRVYPSTSKVTLVLLTTTFSIWYKLPKNPAITFLGTEINKDASLYKGYENQNMVSPLTYEEERKLLRGPGYTEPLFKKIPE
ncbi:hypothetical protein LB507_007922 [Fusarium sp. FIESC RH6]|nr:hypothetical protein LB507_007922 [Fusarium sp. FIESC RH6]